MEINEMGYERVVESRGKKGFNGVRLCKFNVSPTVHHELTIQSYQRDALNIIYSSNMSS